LAESQASVQAFYGDYVLADLAGSGTTLVNGTPLAGPARLEAGDEVQLGRVRLRFAITSPRDDAERAAAHGLDGRSAADDLRLAAPFDALSSEDREAILAQCERVALRADQSLDDAIRGGEPVALYVIAAGTVRLVGELGDAGAQPYTLAVLSAGDLIGERALVDGVAPARGVCAQGEARLLRLTAKAYREHLAAVPRLKTLFEETIPHLGLRRQLERSLLARPLPPPVVEQLVDRLQPVDAAAGETLATRGQPSERLLLLTGGWARILQPRDKREVVVSRLGPGECYGEAIASPDSTYAHTLVAETPLRGYALARTDYLDVVHGDPEIGRRLAVGIDLVPPSVLLQEVPPFNTLPPQLVSQTAAAMRLKTFLEGETIVEQEDPASGFYIIRSGSVAVSFRTSEGAERPVATLGPSQHFGEAALLTGEGRNATVRAAEDCQLWALYRDDFEQALAAGRAFALGTYFSEDLTMRSRPRRLPGVEIARPGAGSDEDFMLRSADGQSYLRLSERGIFVWDLLDGDHTINDVCVAYFAKYNSFGLDAIASTVAQLSGLGFVEVPPTDLKKLLPDPRSAWWERALTRAAQVLTWRTTFPQADDWFEALYRGGGWTLYTPLALVALALLTLAGFAAFGYLVFGVMQGNVPGRDEFDGTALLIIPLGLLLITVLHEIGHALTCKHFGRHVNGAGIGIAYLFPYAFVGTSDVWMVGKGPRIAVSAAGPLVNVVTGSLCAIGSAVAPDVTVRSVLFILAVLSYMLVIGNIHPFMELDGYYVLVDWLEMPSLRKRSMHFLRSGLWRCLRTGRFTREERVLGLFGVAVLVFTVGMGLSLVLFFRDLFTSILSQVLPGTLGDIFGWALSGVMFVVFILPFVFELELLTPHGVTTPARRD
jgi:putative peptide zinc metalloprotease protein